MIFNHGDSTYDNHSRFAVLAIFCTPNLDGYYALSRCDKICLVEKSTKIHKPLNISVQSRRPSDLSVHFQIGCKFLSNLLK